MRGVGRVLATVAAAALIAGGCAFTRQVSHGVPGDIGGSGFAADVDNTGRYVSYAAHTALDGFDWYQVFRVDTRRDTRLLVSRSLAGGTANDDSVETAISGNGHVVAFTSEADDLVAG